MQAELQSGGLMEGRMAATANLGFEHPVFLEQAGSGLAGVMGVALIRKWL